MAITGIFTKSRPAIGGIFFDATLEESDELQTDVTRYPIETGAEGNDHAVNRNLLITMTVALSDNPVRKMIAEASSESFLDNLRGSVPDGILRAATGIGVGIGIGALPASVASVIGVGAGAYSTVSAGQADSRSSTVLHAIRDLQAKREPFTVITSKATYDNCLITNTRRVTNTRNEAGLELVVDIEQVNILNSSIRLHELVNPDDPSAAQAFPVRKRINVKAVPLP